MMLLSSLAHPGDGIKRNSFVAKVSTQDKTWSIVLDTIFTIAAKQIVQFSFKNDPEGLKRENFDPKLLVRAMRAMQMSDCEQDSHSDDERSGQDDDRPPKEVLLNVVFGLDRMMLPRDEFCKILESDKYNWIFDEKKIRDKMRKQFMDEYILETMGC